MSLTLVEAAKLYSGDPLRSAIIELYAKRKVKKGFAFMKFCDENPAIQSWASEAVKIPYRNPFTGKHTIYVPDFFIQYKNKNGSNLVELIEVKPDNQAFKESLGKSKHNQMHYVLNQAKWNAANAYAKSKGIRFRVITEKDMFHQGKR